MNENRMEYYTCRRLRLLSYLRAKGFIPYATLPDITNPKYLVWRFYNTPELQDVLAEYFAQFKK